jgi:hypothetical protein
MEFRASAASVLLPLTLFSGSVLLASEPAPAEIPLTNSVSVASRQPLARNDVAILNRARDANEELYAQLQSFVCHEEIQRFRGSPDGRTSRSLDTITANVSFENGVEHYSDVRQNNHLRPSMAQLAGAWSEGEFGTLLLQSQKLLLGETAQFQAFDSVDGTEAAIYRFQVGEQDSPWDFQVGGQHYHLAFQTDVWISTASGEILKIARLSRHIPGEIRISEVGWTVTLQTVDLNGKQWLLPKSSSYSVLYGQSNRREWNNMSFSAYKRYGSEVALRFGN